MKVLARSCLVAVMAFLSYGTVAAQQQRAPSAIALDEEEEEIRRYSVELIVFEYLDDASTTELFEPDETVLPEDASLPGLMADGMDIAEPLPEERPIGLESETGDPVPNEAIVDESEMSDELLAELLLNPIEEVATLEKAGFEILDPEEYQLDSIYNRLVRLDAYRPLMRGAWIQPALEQQEAIPLKLRRIGNPPLRLDGTVTLYLSRFLHLVVDVAIEEKGPVRPMADERRIRSFGDDRSTARAGMESMFVTPSIYYRIQEDRILRNGDLRYYDHPKFGLLAQVNRIEEEAPDTEDDTAELMPANR